ncbi:MAG: HpcH/HpaI aldolase family protein [Bryobacteraceae bacterium]
MKNRWSQLAQGETLMGSFLSTGYPVNTELMGNAGFDFLIIDLEHGMGSESDILSQLHALQGTPAIPVVRVESHEKQRVHRLLDLGVQGIMFPRVDNAGQARACVAAMRYPPDGARGVATIVRAANYGTNYNEYRADSAANLLPIIQIESAEAVKNVEEIAAVDGVGVLFIGPMDLSTSLGIFRQYDHPLFIAALTDTLGAARRHNRAAGILLPSVETTRHYLNMGFRFITAGTDILLLKTAATQLAESLRGA